MRENLRFNRIEGPADNRYHTDLGSLPPENHRHSGRIKCRLLHGKGYSLLVPDILFVGASYDKWIQPLAFRQFPLIKYDEANIKARIFVDVSCRQTLEIGFSNSGFICNLPDGSQVFECHILGPRNLLDYATGASRWDGKQTPSLALFHHTTQDAKNSILQSRHFRTSHWNIQGSEKRLKNVAYAYFTPLDRIEKPGDMHRVAMDVGGTIVLRRDGFNPPRVLTADAATKLKDDILILNVYASDPSKREATIRVWVEASILAPNHIYRHDEGNRVYYEFPHYFVQRVGTKPDCVVSFDDQMTISSQPNLKSFDYGVVGDCTTIQGLAAPYDEEDTTHILKVERIPDGASLLEFWFANGNRDLFTGKDTELQEFET